MLAKTYLAEDLRPGLKVSFEREITEDNVLAFAGLSGDSNPLHVDAEYARASNYEGRIVHGAFQVGLASAVLGMHLPGKHVLLASVNSRFPAPLYFPTRVVVTGEITSWNLETRGGQLKVVIAEAATHRPTAEIFMGFTLHERKPTRDPETPSSSERVGLTDVDLGPRRLVLVTGASGGLGSAIVEAVAADFDVVALVNRGPLAERVRCLPGVVEARVDLARGDFPDSVAAVIGSRSIYGIIHAAWPGAPRGSLLQADERTIESQVDFGTVLTVRLAQFLFDRVEVDGGRFIAIGSTAGSIKPNLPMGVYSLGKACLENTARLLAPELARKRITMNVACPSFVPVGINKQADQRRVLQETAATPLGRVCQPEDVTAMVRYLLSRDASFVSGQVLALTGAQL